MSREILEKLRAILGSHLDMAATVPTEFAHGRHTAFDFAIDEIDRILAALQSEPTIEEAYRAGFDQGYCKGNNFDVHRPIEEYFADWLKQRAGDDRGLRERGGRVISGRGKMTDKEKTEKFVLIEMTPDNGFTLSINGVTGTEALGMVHAALLRIEEKLRQVEWKEGAPSPAPGGKEGE